MNNQSFVAFALVVIGIVALASRFGGDTGWLWSTGWWPWVGLVAAGFLAAYSRRRTHWFLVTGSILAGVAVGILLEQIWGWDGISLIGLGLGFFAIGLVERQPSHWSRVPAAVLIVLGLFLFLMDFGTFDSDPIWLAIVLIVGGIYLYLSQRENWTLFPSSRRSIPDPPAPEPEAPSEEAIEEESESEETPEAEGEGKRSK